MNHKRAGICGPLVSLLLMSGCTELAEKGYNSVSIGYGVKQLTNRGTQGISHVNIENSDDEPHTNARLQVNFLLSSGEIEEKTFHIGSLDAGEEWEKELDPPMKDVEAIDYTYTCKEGAAKVTLDLRDAEWKSIED